MGESKQRVTREALGVETSSGRVQVRRDHDAATTPFGQLVFFVEFLTLTGVLDRELPSDVPRPPSLNEPGAFWKPDCCPPSRDIDATPTSPPSVTMA